MCRGCCSMLVVLVLLNSVFVHSFLPSSSCSVRRRGVLAPLQLRGVEQTIALLNAEQPLARTLALKDPALREEMDRVNFWSAGNFLVRAVECVGVVPAGLDLALTCEVKGRTETRAVQVAFPRPVQDETALKRVLIEMAVAAGRLREAGLVAGLPFGEDLRMPLDFRFNDVPHAAWVRAYVYDLASTALAQAVNDESIPVAARSRLQMTVNIPEVNPAFDTYRIGTILEMVRRMALTLAYQQKNVRICVQQPLGEGIFVGLPLALASMRVVLEKMDWGTRLDAADVPGNVPGERRIRFGEIGRHVLAADDDVVIVIAPQNVVGAEVTGLLEELVQSAAGRHLVLVNPSLGDRPSSNNVMQIRGRAERRAVQDSFRDIFVMRLLYPSSGGYMFPIRGMVAKQGYWAPYVAYAKSVRAGKEVYSPIGAFPPHPKPAPETLSDLFLDSSE